MVIEIINDQPWAEYEEITNKIMSVIVFFSSIYLLFKHYFDESSNFESLFGTIEYLSGKIGLIFMSMGSLWTVFQTDLTPLNGIVLNIGLAVYITWTAVRFNKLFISSCKKPKEHNESK